MKKSTLWASLLGFVALAAGLLGVNLARGSTPVLGLDLRGGLSVIYATAEPADSEQLVTVRDLMRGQLESFGIAEPDVRVEGENIIVDLPGVSDQASAFEALQVSGIVTLRPVLQCQGGVVVGDGTAPPETTTPTPTATSSPPPDTTTDTSEASLGAGVRPLGFRMPFAAPPTTVPASTVPVTTVAVTTVPGGSATETTSPSTAPPSTGGTSTSVPTSDPSDSTAPGAPVGETTTTLPSLPIDQDVLPYPGADQICLVGPSGGTGEVFAQGSAGASIDQNTGQWVVNVDLRSDGQAVWNSLAQICFNQIASCPSGQLAIVLDDIIQSAPVVRTPDFPGSVQISGSFTESEVRSLARVLNRGAFPVPVEQQRVETVSATAGTDSLNAAVIAGLIGVAITLLFMVAYYRKLSVVIIVGLMVWGMAVFSLATVVSQRTNYALTLAGATGIIVAVGVTVDTYVVFFERLRDETRHGRTMVNAAPRSFQSTWRTILSADLVSLMASIILFWLSVGSVKGFALYLGLTTICDLLVCYFFTRPTVYLLAMTGWLDRRKRAGLGSTIGAVS